MVATIDAVEFINGSARLSPDDVPLGDWTAIIRNAAAELRFPWVQIKPGRRRSLKSILGDRSHTVRAVLSPQIIRTADGGVPPPSLTYFYLGGSEPLPDTYAEADREWRKGEDVLEKHLLLSATRKLFVATITWRPVTKTQPIGVSNFEYEAVRIVIEDDTALEDYFQFRMRRAHRNNFSKGDETPALRAYKTLFYINAIAGNEVADISSELREMTKQHQRYTGMVERFRT